MKAEPSGLGVSRGGVPGWQSLCGVCGGGGGMPPP